MIDGTWQLGQRHLRHRREAKVTCVLSKAAATRCWNSLGFGEVLAMPLWCCWPAAQGDKEADEATDDAE